MEEVVLIFPNQLYKNNDLLKKNKKIFIIEHKNYFIKYPFHKLKLILHRSTMKYYKDYSEKKYDIIINYLEFTYDFEELFKNYKKTTFNFYDPTDKKLMNEINYYAHKYNINIKLYESPNFITSINELENYLKESNHLWKQTSFYIWQRKRLDILLKNEKPIGGKWTFDNENRKKFDNTVKDFKYIVYTNKYIKEATEYILKNFKNNIGETLMIYPITYDEIDKHVDNFLLYRLNNFGKYQDAVDKNILFGYHSIISPMLNIGMISIKKLIRKVLKYYEDNNDISLFSVEGFIRQLIGWREYIRMAYIFKSKNIIKGNFFNHKKKLSKEWYKGTFSIEPINNIIKKAIKYGYAHHIERLMYLGNTMLLLEIDPKDVYKWFMIMFIDSYEWVMVPNVYCLSQFSSIHKITTRPYFSSSNYMIKMSSYGKQCCEKIDNYEWYEIISALYYRFISKNKNILKNNYSTANSVYRLEKKEDIKKILTLANKYIDYL